MLRIDAVGGVTVQVVDRSVATGDAPAGFDGYGESRRGHPAHTDRLVGAAEQVEQLRRRELLGLPIHPRTWEPGGGVVEREGDVIAVAGELGVVVSAAGLGGDVRDAWVLGGELGEPARVDEQFLLVGHGSADAPGEHVDGGGRFGAGPLDVGVEHLEEGVVADVADEHGAVRSHRGDAAIEGGVEVGE